MTLHEQLKKDRMTAMKTGDTYTKDTLTVLLGDLESDSKRGKTVDDAYIMNAIKKSVVNATENHKITNDKKFLREVNLLEAYLPKQMSEVKLKGIINSIIENQEENGGVPCNIGHVMQALKANFDGEFDGKLASKIAKEKL